MSDRHRDIIGDLIARKSNYLAFSPTLGWSIKTNGSSKLAKANAAGMRSDKEYPPLPAPGHRRISTYGDSFTHGDEVKNSETWQAIMEATDSSLEVLNYGVFGFGIDQAYLRYLEEADQYKSKVVLIGFMSENIHRTVSTYRPFYASQTGIPLSKPRFAVKDDQLSLIPNPMTTIEDYQLLLNEPEPTLARLGANDYYFQRGYRAGALDWSPTQRLIKILIQKIGNRLVGNHILSEGRYNPNSEAFRLTKKILSDFYHKIASDGATPMILIFPTQVDVATHRAGERKVYEPLLQVLAQQGFQYLDMMNAFESAVPVDALFSGDHYSPFGNGLVAKYLMLHLPGF
ncbi:MAG: hypothetical protein CMH56_17460 [Myxococcales bacterium]|nr:hypothetical protein [Myxococcales bacterium]